MSTRRLRTFTIVCILLSGFVVFCYPAVRVEGAGGSGKKLILEARSREPLSDGTGRFRVVQKKLEWEPRRTAIIICDMWDQHWCKGATSRVGELAPRMNRIVRRARNQGVLIIHAPSGTVDHYENHPARKIAKEAPKAANLPGDISNGADGLIKMKKRWDTPSTIRTGVVIVSRSASRARRGESRWEQSRFATRTR